MATKYSMSIRTLYSDDYEPVALFSDSLPMDRIMEMCDTLYDSMGEINGLQVVDMDTGVIEYDVEDLGRENLGDVEEVEW